MIKGITSLPLLVTELRPILSQLTSHINEENRGLVMNSANVIVKSMHESKPNVELLVDLFTLYSEKGWLTTSEPLIDSLKMSMAMTIERHMHGCRKETIIRAISCLTEQMHLFGFSTYREFENIYCSMNKIEPELASKVLRSYAILSRRMPNALRDLVIEGIADLSSPSSIINSLEALCVLKRQELGWHLLKKVADTQLDDSLHQKLRVIRYATELEKPFLSMPKMADLPPKEKSSFLMINRQSVLHREVDYVINQLGETMESFVNIDDAYLVDFKKDRLLIEIEPKLHYFRPARGHSYESGPMLNGYTLMKYRLLAKKHYQLANLPFFEWNKHIDIEEKCIYLRRKIRRALENDASSSVSKQSHQIQDAADDDMHQDE